VRRQLILISLILSAFFLRVWQLSHTPPGLWYDEAYHGMDALWMTDTDIWPLFFIGNNGREALWVYLVWLATSLWGNTVFALRFVAALTGVLTIPIFYRFAIHLSTPLVQPSQRVNFALLATTWLAVSWWHIHLSRAGFRPILLPPLLMASLYFFLLSVKHLTSLTVKPIKSTLGYIALAGFFLGVSQYTYLPARLAPLIFIGLIILQSWQNARPTILRLWGVLILTGFVSMILFMPMAFFFLQYPQAFSARTNDVIFYPDTVTEFLNQLWQTLTLFLGAGHELYRHHLPERAMLGWLEIPFFFIGLVSLLRPTLLRSTEGQTLLLACLTMMLPTFLAEPPIHALRPVGILPFYYLFITYGLWQMITWVQQRAFQTNNLLPMAYTLILFGGLLNSYDYFVRWANHPDTYREYNSTLVDLTEHILQQTITTDLLIPFHVYVHPTTRYLLHRDFLEQSCQVDCLPSSNRPRQLMVVPQPFPLLFVGNIPESPMWVWLTRDEIGQGRAYISRPPYQTEQSAIDTVLNNPNLDTVPYTDQIGQTVAWFKPITDTLNPLFKEREPQRTISLIWGDTEPLAELVGYEVTPSIVQPNQPITLNLYWRALTNQTFDKRLFLQLINTSGNPINQWEGDAFMEDMYRWRFKEVTVGSSEAPPSKESESMLATQHTLWVGQDTPTDAYLIRLGFFDKDSGGRLPLTMVQHKSVDVQLDQAHLGLFYVTSNELVTNPSIIIQTNNNFADHIKLTGFNVDLDNPTELPVTLYWQTIAPTDKPYTVFLQLFNEQGDMIKGWDSQPFNELYPTTIWSPHETLHDTFNIPLPENGFPPGQYRLITGWYDVESGQRLPLTTSGDFIELTTFMVE